MQIIITILVTIAISSDISISEDINKAMDYYMMGEVSLIENDIISAEIYFTEALKFSPNNPAILESLLDINIENKNFINIEKILEQYLLLNTLNINYSLKLINLYKRSAQHKLFKIIDLLILNNPKSMDLKYEKAQLLIFNENWDELLSLYSEMYLVEENQELFDTLLNLGLTIENPNILYGTLKYIWENSSKTNIKILELLIQLSYLSEEESVTVKYLRELLEYDPNNQFAIMMLAEINILNKNFIESIELLNRIKDIHSNSIDLFRMLLISYSNLGDYQREIDLSIEIINKFPFETIGYESLAISYLETNQYVDAIEILNEAIKIFPEEYYFYYYLGLCYRNKSKNKQAIDYFLKALKINPNLKNIIHELAKLYNIEFDYKNSDSLFTLLLEENVNDAIIMNDYAYLIADREDVSKQKLDLALELSRNVISIVPDSPEYLDTIGWIYYKMGKYQKALDYLLRSQSIDQKNLIILEHLGDVYSKLKKHDKALYIYKQIMVENPNNSEINRKIRLLNEQ